RLADEAQRLPLAELERHVVDRMHARDLVLEDDPLADREVELEVVDRDERAVRAHTVTPSTSSPICPGETSRRPRLSSSESQQRSRWPAASGTRASSGGTSEHLSNSCGQRARKWQPFGGSISDGGEPGIDGSRLGRGRSTRVIEPSSPHVYG